jgi:hypothetical protein
MGMDKKRVKPNGSNQTYQQGASKEGKKWKGKDKNIVATTH